MTTKRNTEAVVRLAAEKSMQARQRVRQAVALLREQGKPINFNTVSKTAQVSKTFLYDPKHADLAQEIRRERTAVPGKSPTISEPVQRKSDQAKDAQIDRLKERVRKLEQQIIELQQENELLYGKLAKRASSAT